MENAKRNLFEVENARNLSPNEVISTFVPTPSFWRLLTSKNHIVLGARGSGKTALIKMLAHDHLSKFDSREAKRIIDKKEFIGMYVPTRLEWVGGLKNKQWNSEAEAELFFQWRLNISTCAAYLVTLKSCFETYMKNPGERARAELDLSKELSTTWSYGELELDTFDSLQIYLEDIEHDKQAEETKARVRGVPSNAGKIGSYFESDLFQPLRRAIRLASRSLHFPDSTVWMLCLDEAEFLEPFHHKILNSHLRTYPDNLVFKITTMPYCHYTLDTNIEASLNVGHDFEYVYIDKDPVTLSTSEDSGEFFAKQLFEKRASQSINHHEWERFEMILGKSVLLDSKTSEWTEKSLLMGLMKNYASVKTLQRAESLAGTPAFKDQISRKMHGALLLKDAEARSQGNKKLDVYSGLRMAIRCSDGNPRRLIRIINALINVNPKNVASETSSIPKTTQTAVLIAFATSTLTRVQSEPKYGIDLFNFMKQIGTYMKSQFHDYPLTTDQISSISLDICSDKEWEVIKTAVGLGLLFPNINLNSGDQMPERVGTFRMAYVLSPLFRLLPRRGKAIALSKILNNIPSKNQRELNEQLSFFEGRDL